MGRLLKGLLSPESYSLVFTLPQATIGHIVNAVWCQRSIHSFATLAEPLMDYYNLLIMFIKYLIY